MTTPTTVNVRLQLRADTAANWTAANPTLLANEVGLETDTKKLKVGSGSTAWNSLAYFPSIVTGGTVLGNLEIGSTGTLTFEGSTADGFETTLAVTNPTADRTITLPDQSGTVVVTGNASIVDADIAANAEIAVSKLANGTANQVIVTDGTNVSWSDDLTLAGNLTVNGTTTTINTQDLLVEDKNIIIGNVDTPSDVTADGGGITLKGTTDKTINWVDATDAWTSSERFSIPLGSAASPSLTFTGDPNTGIYSPGADQVAISTGGAQALYINADGDILVADGNRMEIDEIRARDGAGLKLFDDAGAGIFVKDGGAVGIGTSSPDTALHLASTSPVLRFENPTTTSTTGTSMGKIEWETRDASAPGVIGYIDVVDSNNFGTAFDMQLATGVSGAATTKVTIKADGKVGIGTTSPLAPFHVGSIASNTYALFDDGTNARITFNGSTSTAGIYSTTTGFASYEDLEIRAAATIFKRDGTNESARLDSSGKLLVGTSTARSNFAGNTATPQVQIEGVTAATASSSITRGAADATGPTFNLGKTRGASVGLHTVVASGDQCGVITFQGADGTNLIRAAQIAAEVDGTPGANDMPGRLVFSTTADGASSPTERMTIKSDGRCVFSTSASTTISRAAGIGPILTNSSSSIAGAGIEITTDSTATRYCQIFTIANSIVGTITTSGAATAYNTSSDYRLKENVTPVSDGITRLQQLKPARFNFIANPDTVVDGFLAHEVQAVVPEAITGEKDAVDEDGNPEYQGIDQSKLVPLLTAALQEAIAKIETLEQRLSDAGIA